MPGEGVRCQELKLQMAVGCHVGAMSSGRAALTVERLPCPDY